MRKIPGIKYTVPRGGCFAITIIILIVAVSFQSAYSATKITRMNIAAPQTRDKLVRYDKAEENRMIKEQKLYNYYTVKVTTTNQKKFDRDKDGYLSGTQLKKYLREYYR